jgi:hypothetical protein
MRCVYVAADASARLPQYEHDGRHVQEAEDVDGRGGHDLDRRGQHCGSEAHAGVNVTPA